MLLLQDEQKAKDFVLAIGEKRANRLLNLLTFRIALRIRKANEACSVAMFYEGNIRVAEWETNLIHDLKMGICLTDTFNTPLAAKERIQKRIDERKARAALRLAAQAA